MLVLRLSSVMVILLPVIQSDHNNTDPMLMPLAVLVMVTLSNIMMKELLANRVPILVLIKVLVMVPNLLTLMEKSFDLAVTCK